MAEELVSTPLLARHRNLGAKLVDFAGWQMPLTYSGALAEHRQVREAVGVFDVSHLGAVWVTGAGARETVSRTFTNDPWALTDGQSQYTLCCADDGGIVDDLIVYRVAGDRWLAVPNAANTATVVAALRAVAREEGAQVHDRSREQALLAVQGPQVRPTVRAALGIDVATIDYLAAVELEALGETALVSRTGYTGEPGCELVLPAATAGPVFDALVEAGATPAGLGARDTLRLEMGYPLHGNDIDRGTRPREARLGWAVKLDHGEFTGRAALRADADGPLSRRLWGLVGGTRRPPRQGMRVQSGGEDVGVVTSGSFSPGRGVGIGLAYLDAPVGPGDEVVVDARGTQVSFEVVRPPFVERDPRQI